jgi:hypothetical protein
VLEDLSKMSRLDTYGFGKRECLGRFFGVL